jgi:ADP-ribose pyrophosphatase YjhB (NUDIX family)
MASEAIPSWYFTLVVVRRGDSFLVVHERKHGGGWYLPAGRVEPGETLEAAARRETLEESGVEIELDGILRVEHTPSHDHTRVRVFYLAHPVPGSEPRDEENEHTLGARFHTLEELRTMPLRGTEVLRVFEAVIEGAHVSPLSLVTHEAAGW